MKDLIENLKVYGEENLTNEQLLCVAIWGENTNEKNLKIAKNLIRNNKDLTGDLRFLMHISLNELISQGLKENEAVRIKAFSELLKRICYPINPKKMEINSSTEAANLLMAELRFEKIEYIKLIILTNRNQVLKILTLSKGTSNGATITPKDILSEPVKMKATRIILVHNHPSRRFKT